jgi:replicative DNA helicase
MSMTDAPPSLHNLDAEQAVLGALLVDNSLIERVIDTLAPDRFHDPVHGQIWSWILERHACGALADGITLRDAFVSHEGLKAIGGALYIAELVDAQGAPAAISDYARLIAELALRRDLAAAADAIRSEAMAADGVDGGTSALDRAQARLLALEPGHQHRAVSAGEAIRTALDEALAASRSGVAPGLSTGLADLDLQMGRLRPGGVTVVAGRPGMGKSAVVLSVTKAVALAGYGAAYLTPEMDASEHGFRLAVDIAHQAGERIPYQRLQQGQANEAQVQAVRRYANIVSDLPILFDDRGDLPFNAIAGRIRSIRRAIKQRFGVELALVVIDHIGLIQPPSLKGGGRNKVEELSFITGALKRLARMMNIHIIEVCQLNRGVESREDKRPTLADLRDSGSIEQDANNVLLIYRDEYYAEAALERVKAAGGDVQDAVVRREAARDRIEIDCAKVRGGRRGRVHAKFYAPYSALRPADHSNPDEDPPELFRHVD